jgi:putative ATPase
VLERIAVFANGDARAAYNTLEARHGARGAGRRRHGKRAITEELLSSALQRKFLQYDKSGEEHYNMVSALHKSVRNSDADATLYWLARMLESGEEPLYIARRLVRMASEDIGLADPAALGIAVAAMQAADFIGVPEGNLALAEAAVYLALAPKSNALYTGYGEAQSDLQNHQCGTGAAAPAQRGDRSDEASGIRRGYQYAHDDPDKVTRHDAACRKVSREGATINRAIRASSSGCARAWKRFARLPPNAARSGHHNKTQRKNSGGGL